MAVLLVPETYASVAAAIAAASPGDTIQIGQTYRPPDVTPTTEVTVDNLTFSSDLNGRSIDYLVAAQGVTTITTTGTAPFYVYGNSGDNHITGGDGFNYLTDSYPIFTGSNAPTGDDTLDGGGGRDWLIVRNGVDVAFGGGGGDDRLLVDYRQSQTAVVMSPGLVSAGADRSVTYSGVELLIVYGGDANDSLIGGDGDDVLDGYAGDDTIEGGAGRDVLAGSDGDDLLIDGRGSDGMTGDAGNDTVDFSAAQATLLVNLERSKDDHGNIAGFAEVSSGIEVDALRNIENAIGGAFRDVMMGSSLANVLSGGGGDDQLFGRSGADTLHGDDGDDFLDGGTGDDQLFGGDGNDVFAASAGADVMHGDDGDDRYRVNDASDQVIEAAGGGDDLVFALADWTMGAGQRIELVAVQSGARGLAIGGNEFANRIYGDAGADTLSGAEGVDRLFGGSGADRLVGGIGADFLKGEAGADTFAFDAKPILGAERDRIADFVHGEDRIEIDASEFGGGLTAGATVTLVANAHPTAAGQSGPTFLYNTDTGNLSFDDDGQGGHAAVAFAVLLNGAALTADDFLIVG